MLEQLVLFLRGGEYYAAVLTKYLGLDRDPLETRNILMKQNYFIDNLNLTKKPCIKKCKK